MAAGNLLQHAAWGDQLHQKAGLTGLAVSLSIEIHTGGGVLKSQGRPTRGVRRTPIAAVFEKAKLESQEIQESAIVFWHGRLHEHIVVLAKRGCGDWWHAAV